LQNRLSQTAGTRRKVGDSDELILPSRYTTINTDITPELAERVLRSLLNVEDEIAAEIAASPGWYAERRGLTEALAKRGPLGAAIYALQPGRSQRLRSAALRLLQRVEEAG
jgi:hypothetical protein